MSGGGVARQDDPAARPADARGVADERDPRVRQEVTDVMRRVAWGVRPRQIVADDVQGTGLSLWKTPGRGLLAVSGSFPQGEARPQDRHSLFATGRTSPQSRSMSAPYSREALVEQLRRIDQVRRAAFVHVHRRVRAFGDERAGGAGMVEVDVREQDRAHVGEREAARRQRRDEAPAASSRPRVDEGHALWAMQQHGRDDPALAEKLEIEIVHARSEWNQRRTTEVIVHKIALSALARVLTGYGKDR